MKKITSLSLFLLCSCLLFAQNYGAYVQPPSVYGAYDFKIKVSTDLCLSSYRDAIILGNYENPKSLSSAFDIVLNINTCQPVLTGPVAYISDTVKYRKDMETQMKLFIKKPKLLVIENEETNPKYHKGNIHDYIDELKIGTDVAHANGIGVTNAGLTRTGILYCMYDDLLKQGKSSEAKDFAARTKLAVRNSNTQSQGAMVQQLLIAYRLINIDAVNLHFYASSASDVSLLEEMVIFLRKQTGKPVLSNEAGQFDMAPETVTALLNMAKQLKMPFFLWYSGTGNNGAAKPLHKDDGTLYSSGTAFQKFVSGERTRLW